VAVVLEPLHRTFDDPLTGNRRAMYIGIGTLILIILLVIILT
jgi:hypothetical protein